MAWRLRSSSGGTKTGEPALSTPSGTVTTAWLATTAGPAAYADIPLRRPGTATEAASAMLAMCSPLFSYVTGQTVMVGGGRNM